MVNRRLTTAEAADQLGVKPATLYAYVSRGLLQRERTPAGSSFDPRDVAKLARSARHPSGPGVGGADEPVFVTELTLIEAGRLYYRGSDAIELSRSRRFEEVAEWLWTATWPEAGAETSWRPRPPAAVAVSAALTTLPRNTLPLERFAVAIAAAGASDNLRHDLNPAAVPIVGRALLSALVDALPPAAPRRKVVEWPAPISARLWSRLSPLPLTPSRAAVLESALVLVADHELAPSTLAARVAAAFRADPYAVVLTGLGPASGSWYSGSSGAPTEVEALLAEASASEPERAIGARLRRTGSIPHGFGMPLYPDGDPRATELLARLPEIDGDPGRHATVARLNEIASERGFPHANVDLGLGALSYCAQMVVGAGQTISTFGKMAGWLAHAMEEYGNPTRFRSRADYVGPRPDSTRPVSPEA